MKAGQTTFKSHGYKTMGQQGTCFDNGENQENKEVEPKQTTTLMDRQQQERETGKSRGAEKQYLSIHCTYANISCSKQM